MKMRKFISLLLTVAVVLSLGTTAFAAPTAGPDEAPVVSVEVTTVTATKAKLNINYSINADDLRAYEEVEDDNLDVWSYGKGINYLEVEFIGNSKYFDQTSGATVTGYAGTKCNKLSTNYFNYCHLATNDSQWITDSNTFTIASVTLTTSAEIQARYNELLAANGDNVDATKAALIAELNAKTDLISYNKVLNTTQAYPAEGVMGSGEAKLQYYTKYYSDGTGDYGIVAKTGADAPVEPEDAIVNDDTPVIDDATETKKWEDVSVTAGLVGEGKIKAVLSYDDGVTQKTQNVALTFGDGLEFTGEGSLVFDVIVHFQDYANAPYTNLEIVKVTE